MKRYLIAYGIWLASVLGMGAVALFWYKHVERIGWEELGDKLRARAVEPTAPDSDGTGSQQ